jgi:putrescine aminotransferase
MKLAFYKAHQGGLDDKLISWWTKGKFSHTEIVSNGYMYSSSVEEKNLHKKAISKGELFKKLLKHSKIKEVRGIGLFLAVDLGSSDLLFKFMEKALENGILTDWFLFNDRSFRITPPLTITEDEIKFVAKKILRVLNEI